MNTNAPGVSTLALFAVRRALGISLVLYAFYIAAHSLWGLAPIDAFDVLAILGVVLLGVWLGVGFSVLWPLPEERGVPRVVRTLMLTTPALGLGIAIQLFLVGPRGERAYYVMFALAAWLGSTFVREDGPDDDRESNVEAGNRA